MQNQNSVEYLEKIKIKIFENLRETTFVPSVEMQDIPRISLGMDDEDDAMLDDADDDDNPDIRLSRRKLDEAAEASGELSESEDEDSDFLASKEKTSNGRKNERNHKETGSGLSDVDENVSRISERSSSPKSIASESESEDVEMKDAGDATGDIEVEMAVQAPENKVPEPQPEPDVAEPSKASSGVPTHPNSPLEPENLKAASPPADVTKDTEIETTESSLANLKVETNSA